jgi:glycerol uptake facilitator-like aquaporin
MLLLSAGYTVAIDIGYNGAKIPMTPVNPAIFGGVTTSYLFAGHYDFGWGFIFIVFPFLGAFLAVIAFEKCYKNSKGA